MRGGRGGEGGEEERWGSAAAAERDPTKKSK